MMDDDAFSRLSYPAAMYSPAPTRSIPPTPHLPNETFQDYSPSPSSPPPPRRAIPPPPPDDEPVQAFGSPMIQEFGTPVDSPAVGNSTLPFSRPRTPSSPRTALRPSTIQFPKRFFPNRSLHASPANSPDIRPSPAVPPPLPPRPPVRSRRGKGVDSQPEGQGDERGAGVGVLGGIEIVPPTPPALSRPVDIPQDDVPTPSTPDNPENENAHKDSSLRTPASRVARLTGTGRNMANRLSKTFHDGTPPPAVVRLPYPDVVGRDTADRRRNRESGQMGISRRPVSNVYVRGAGVGDPRRLSVASGHVDDGGGSRRQSVVSAHFEPHPVHHHQYDDDERIEEGDEIEEMRYHHASTSTRNTARSANRPGAEHQETAMSDETYVTATSNSHSHNTWDTSSNSNSNSNSNSSSLTTQTGRRRRRGDVEGMMRVDPLTILERRRRRDYTIGSHHPLHGPPNTPAVRPVSVAAGSSHPRTPGGAVSVTEADEEEEIESIKFVDVVDRFRSMMRRFSDMPWIAEPCVATLIIPQNNSNANDGESTIVSHSNQAPGGVVYGFGPGGNGGAVGGVGGTINGIRPRGMNHRKSSSTSAASGAGADAEGERKKKELPAGWYRPRPSLDEILGEGPYARQNVDTEANAAEGDAASSTGGDTVVPPPIPARTKGIWYPQKPEPTAQTPGRERFADALVIRGLRRFST